jgi:type VI secretion system protein ImpH
MSSTSRRKNTSVIQGLLARPFEYSFRQAVRLLERAAVYYTGTTSVYSKNPVARYMPPASEVVRFHTRQSLSFPASEISSIEERKTQAGSSQQHMLINFMGLTGSTGIMPYHYSELVLKRLKIKDRSLMDFLDLFNHRLVSLFYQASVKYQLPLELERKKLGATPGTDSDSHTKILLALIGLGTNGLNRRLYTKDESLIYYSGLFTKKVRTTAGLKQIIFHHFSIPVEIKEFIGQWQELIDDVRTRLPSLANPRGQNSQLGKSVMLGRKGWFAQGKIRIILGPLTKEQLHTFAPGTATLKALDEIVRLYINFEHDYDYVMRIKRSDIPGTVKLSSAAPPVVGWNTWLSPNADHYLGSQTIVDIPVSARRLL